jgi:hypothetical protein
MMTDNPGTAAIGGGGDRIPTADIVVFVSTLLILKIY